MNAGSPPKVADWLLRKCLPVGELGESIRGDLYEEYRSRTGGLGSRIWYLWQAVAVSLKYVGSTIVKRRNRRGRNVVFHSLRRDVRHAVRRWRKRPLPTALVVATLGLGIGATTAMFSVVDRVLLQSLPYPNSHELVTVWNTYPGWRGHEVLDALWDAVELSYPEYIDWRNGQTAFQSVGIYSTGTSTLTGLGDPTLVGFGRASASLFPMLGVRPALGRTFRFEEEGDAGAWVAVVSHSFWTTRLGSDRDVIGRTITVDGERFTVVGVLPASFRLRSLIGVRDAETEIWVPAGIFGDAHDRGWHTYEAIARVHPGVTLEQAAADAGPLLRGNASIDRQGIRTLWRQDEERGSNRAPLLLLLGSAGVLMVIAGVNAATLQTAETSARRHELVTRRAVGASRWQVVSQLVTESLCLGLLGSLLGLLVGLGGVSLLIGLAPSELMLPDRVPISIRVLAFCSSLGVILGLFFGVVPALMVTRGNTGALAASRTTTGYRGNARAQRMMVAVQAGLCLALLAIASLLTRSLMKTNAVNPGFSSENLIAVSLPLSGARTQPELVTQFARDLSNDYTGSRVYKPSREVMPYRFRGRVVAARLILRVAKWNAE